MVAGAATITSIDPAGQLPGQRIEISGTDLGPRGGCRVTFTEQGTQTSFDAFGRTNGFDRVVTFLPRRLDFAATYDVTVTLGHPRFGSTVTTNAIAYTTGAAQAPVVASSRASARDPAFVWPLLFPGAGSGYPRGHE